MDFFFSDVLSFSYNIINYDYRNDNNNNISFIQSLLCPAFAVQLIWLQLQAWLLTVFIIFYRGVLDLCCSRYYSTSSLLCLFLEIIDKIFHLCVIVVIIIVVMKSLICVFVLWRCEMMMMTMMIRRLTYCIQMMMIVCLNICLQYPFNPVAINWL